MTGLPSSARSLDAHRLQEVLGALAAQLGQTSAEVAGTLRAELTRAVAEIDSGIAAGDAEAVGGASHAARNSVLMLDDGPMLTALRSLEAAVRRGDLRATTAARSEVHERWGHLAEVLGAVA
jgi:hypothetical protein